MRFNKVYLLNSLNLQIFQSVVRLGEAYISLCKAGEVSHLNWTFEFKCTERLTESPLQANDLASQSDEMEECLKMWKNELHQKRLHYKELNHYTTMQLLVLRSKLANLRSKGPKAMDDIPLEVYNLLDSALPGVEAGILKSVFISCGICSQETGQSNLMSFGGGCTIQQSAFGKQLVPVKNLQSSQEETFQSLVAHLESIESYSDPEEIAIAAMWSCKHASETDMIVWCVKNGNNEDLVRSKYSEALLDPSYCALVNKDASVSIKGERYRFRQLPVVSRLSGNRELHSRIFHGNYQLQMIASYSLLHYNNNNNNNNNYYYCENTKV